MLKIDGALKDDGIHPSNLPEGRLAVISDCMIPAYIGRVVQRRQNALIAIDGGKNCEWNAIFVPQDFKVKLLLPGTKFVTEKNSDF